MVQRPDLTKYAKKLGEGEGTDVKLVMYKNGYTVDDGPFVSNASPEGKKFVA